MQDEKNLCSIFFVEDEILVKLWFNPIQASVFWNDIGWGGAHCAPSVSPLFVVQLQPNLA